MTWQYRLFRHDDDEIEIVEAIYEDEKLTGWTAAFSLRGDSLRAVHELVTWIYAALHKPVLDRTSFGTEFCCDEHQPAKTTVPSSEGSR